MAFNPSSTIYLCNVPIDSTYKNQIYFTNSTQQYSYFAARSSMRFSNYLTVRETLPDGSLQSAVKVNANIDDLREYNYMFYQNANHGTRFYYAFITKLIYINEETTKIVFQTDVFQTWMFDVEILQSYVVREHSETDNIGDNTVPEKFEMNDYTYNKVMDLLPDDTWGYLVGSSDALDSNGVDRGRLMCGIYQGMYFYFFTNVEALNNFIESMETENGEAIQFITLIPAFCMGGSTWENGGLLSASEEPASYTASIADIYGFAKFNGFTPRNNKLFTYPFTTLMVVNHSGGEAEYKIEDFSTSPKVEFVLCGDISVSPSICAIPLKYKGLEEAYEQGISISGFPQCSFNNDTFKLWLAKNQFGAGIDVASGLVNVGVGVGSGLMGNPLGASQAVNGAMQILSTMNSAYKATKEPNKVNMGNSNCNLLTAMNQNHLTVQLRHIKPNFARSIDDYFTMFGYQTNRVKMPNLSSRPYFNYIQTAGINITGGIPDSDMRTLKSIYDNGVTLWKPSATVGDYSVDNSPS